MHLSILEKFFGARLTALLTKETRELLRNRYLVFLLLVPPIIQLLILGAALDPAVKTLTLAVVDHSRTADSRRFKNSLLDTTVFKETQEAENETELKEKLRNGSIDVGIEIPATFSEDLGEAEKAPINVLLDGADAYTAGIARSYVSRTISNFKPEGRGLAIETSKVPEIGAVQKVSFSDLNRLISEAEIEPSISMLYNPQQKGSWYFVPGVLGACLTLVATLVASAMVLRERESGTIDQLLMTPASTWEMILAKILPLLTFLMADVILALTLSQITFGMPVRGNYLLLMICSTLYALSGIGIGILLGSLCTSQRQAQLSSFFFNIPLILLSGTVVPFDTMPKFFQSLAIINPLRYYTIIVRDVILKGTDITMLWSPILVLSISAAIILTVGSYRLRKQMSLS